MRDALTQLARGEGDLTFLTVTSDGLHDFHGDLRLTIRGDGTIQQQALPTTVADPKDKVTQDDLKALVARLVKYDVWTQRIDERPPVPDESRATLKTCYRDQCVDIWQSMPNAIHDDLSQVRNVNPSLVQASAEGNMP